MGSVKVRMLTEIINFHYNLYSLRSLIGYIDPNVKWGKRDGVFHFGDNRECLGGKRGFGALGQS